MDDMFSFWYTFFSTSAQISQKYVFGEISHLEMYF